MAIFTLFVIMVLSGITQREKNKDRTIFSVLTGALTVFIGVILVSSLQRLALYEAAYGFTRLRTYSHLCMIWIGVLFLAILLLEIFQKYRFFTLATVGAVAGFVFTMNAINVDGFITQRNIQRLVDEDAGLDTHYLKTLSDDAIPDLVLLAEDPILTGKEEAEIKAILACRAIELEDTEWKWQSFTLPTALANTALKRNPQLWSDVELEEEHNSWYVDVEGSRFYCGYRGWE